MPEIGTEERTVRIAHFAGSWSPLGLAK